MPGPCSTTSESSTGASVDALTVPVGFEETSSRIRTPSGRHDLAASGADALGEVDGHDGRDAVLAAEDAEMALRSALQGDDSADARVERHGQERRRSSSGDDDDVADVILGDEGHDVLGGLEPLGHALDDVG
jgi:hypothetical protein